MIRAAIFDLDGTLLDTLGDIGGAMNHALAAHGLPEHPLDSYRGFVGEGARHLTERATAPRVDLASEVYATYQRYYSEHLVVSTEPFEGISVILEHLAIRAVALAVLSNKPDPSVRELIERFFPGRFQRAQGERAGVPRKPDPTSALEIAAALGSPPSSTAFIGDSAIDIRTGRAAGMRAIGVSWGMRGRDELLSAGADRVVDSPDDLVRALFERP